MNRSSRIAAILLIIVCVAADCWVIERFVINKPKRAVVMASSPGKATVRVESMPLGTIDYAVCMSVLFGNVAAAVVVAKAFKAPRFVSR